MPKMDSSTGWVKKSKWLKIRIEESVYANYKEAVNLADSNMSRDIHEHIRKVIKESKKVRSKE